MIGALLKTLCRQREIAKRIAVLCFVLMSPASVHSQETDCAQGIALQQTFDSGASWSMCAEVSELNGLQVSKVFYRAPGDLNRSVLAEAQLSQILLHYHDSTIEEAQINPALSITDSEQISEIIIANDRNCDGSVLGTILHPNSICQRVIDNGILAKFDLRPGVQTQAWELSSAMTRETLTWNTAWTFTEDGQIRPRLSLSGRSSRRNNNEQYAQQTHQDVPAMTRASIFSTWRLVPALDTDAPDTAEAFDFPLDVVSGNRRPMQISAIAQESFQNMNRENFRGWRMLDESGAGYYIDPANNGHSYTSATHNWANFTIAFTRAKACELHALGNLPSLTQSDCATNLDEFVNDELLADTNIAIWFSQTRHLDPSVEDWPVLRDVQIGFDLLPFDWTAASPFELAQ